MAADRGCNHLENFGKTFMSPRTVALYPKNVNRYAFERFTLEAIISTKFFFSYASSINLEEDLLKKNLFSF